MRRFARGSHSTVILLGVALAATVTAATPMRERAEPKRVSGSRFVYRITQDGAEKGKEVVEQQAFDNNTIDFDITCNMLPAQGISMDQKVELTLEEESHFPRALHVVKTIKQAERTFDHIIDIEMFANVAVIESEISGAKDRRRVVVPTGIAVLDPGIVTYWHQILFWYDREVGGRQRFQWLEPTSGRISNGELFVSGEQTITIMKKKTPVTVYTADREVLGQALLYVDKQGRIVKGEQNMMTFELVEAAKR